MQTTLILGNEMPPTQPVETGQRQAQRHSHSQEQQQAIPHFRNSPKFTGKTSQIYFTFLFL